MVTVQALRKFRRHFNLPSRVPTKHAIRTWVESFEQTGSVGKRKSSGRPRSARIPENVKTVKTSMQRSSQRSVRKVAAAVTVNRRSIQRILRELKFHPYKLQVVQELKQYQWQRSGACLVIMSFLGTVLLFGRLVPPISQYAIFIYGVT